MKKLSTFLFVVALLLANIFYFAQTNPVKAAPSIVDGEAQVVAAFEDTSKWIREDLWVETEFDTDGDGRMDRMHVDVTRPAQTQSEGLKLPVVYETSPYFAGTAGFVSGLFWSVRHNLGVMPPVRVHPEVERKGQAADNFKFTYQGNGFRAGL